ncbi:hypothetical protein ADH76_12725 [Enterocloster clostridioformis]|nr:hypothetical protein A4V08_36740 [Lachnoclostridium sp. YL32]OXE69229.1 hypothetical protein ADH76_12725 [Enterocloster clostridioformis]
MYSDIYDWYDSELKSYDPKATVLLTVLPYRHSQSFPPNLYKLIFSSISFAGMTKTYFLLLQSESLHS